LKKKDEIAAYLFSISPTFYEQILHKYSFAKKITKPNCKQEKAMQNTFVQKAALKMLVKLTLGV
jgi:hypothetical protein